MDLIPSTPFVITLPANATVNSAGEVVVNLTPDGSGAALDDLSNVTPATGRTALGVPATTAVDLKADVHLMGPIVIDVDSVASLMPPVIWRPGFAGTLTRASAIVAGGPIATGPAAAVIAIAGVSCTLSAPLSAPIASAEGFAVDVAVSALGAFTADQAISVTPDSTNADPAWLCVAIEYTRA